MARAKTRGEKDIQDLVISVAEVQLATIHAGIDFWSGWVKQATEFSKVADRGLKRIKKSPEDSAEILLEITDASQEHLRTMMELPRQAAIRFADELKAQQGRGSKKTRKRAARAKP